MVSIMRSEQTLRLIQLYHANYPEIARNNQDADGRNLKLQMWAQITEELNRAFETTFTVEQFKKKVQNVQCTSRQKLFSGKRNLGEAEVEYLRLFESDKISEETLVHRAKNRRVPMTNSVMAADFLVLKERHQIGEYQLESVDNQTKMGEWEEEERQKREWDGEERIGMADGSEGGEVEDAASGDEGAEEGRKSGGETGPNGSGTASTESGGRGSESGAISAALSSIGALFGANGSGSAENSQIDMWTQQILLTMMNAAMMSGVTTIVEGEGKGSEGGETPLEEHNSERKMATKGRERKRKQQPDEEEGIARREGATRIMGAPAPKRCDGATDEQRGAARGEPTWTNQLLKVQREMFGQQQQRRSLAQFADETAKGTRVLCSSASDSASSLSHPSPASSSSPSPTVPSSFSLHAAAHCQCTAATNGNGCAAFFSLERELCARLDTTNAMLARIVELILERLPSKASVE